MSTQEQQANIGKVLSFLREWDRGDMRVRGRMLSTFVTQNTGKTFYELELEFAQVASLFLARLTTWMKLTYPLFSRGLGKLLVLDIYFLYSSKNVSWVGCKYFQIVVGFVFPCISPAGFVLETYMRLNLSLLLVKSARV